MLLIKLIKKIEQVNQKNNNFKTKNLRIDDNMAQLTLKTMTINFIKQR